MADDKTAAAPAAPAANETHGFAASANAPDPTPPKTDEKPKADAKPANVTQDTVQATANSGSPRVSIEAWADELRSAIGGNVAVSWAGGNEWAVHPVQWPAERGPMPVLTFAPGEPVSDVAAKYRQKLADLDKADADAQVQASIDAEAAHDDAEMARLQARKKARKTAAA